MILFSRLPPYGRVHGVRVDSLRGVGTPGKEYQGAGRGCGCSLVSTSSGWRSARWPKAGTAGVVLGLVLLAASRVLLIIYLAYALLQIAAAVAQDAYQGWLPDGSGRRASHRFNVWRTPGLPNKQRPCR